MVFLRGRSHAADLSLSLLKTVAEKALSTKTVRAAVRLYFILRNGGRRRTRPRSSFSMTSALSILVSKCLKSSEMTSCSQSPCGCGARETERHQPKGPGTRRRPTLRALRSRAFVARRKYGGNFT